MATPTFSAKLPDVTMRQLAELAAQFGTSKSQVVIQAVRQLHQQEIKTMNTETSAVKILSINTKPKHDPYTNIEGITSRTYLKLDPSDRTVWVTQEYNDNATPSDEWHGLVKSFRVNTHPLEDDMRRWIEENMTGLTTICDGFERVWNGSNHVGSYNEAARAAIDAIEYELDNDMWPMNYYEVWTVESWLESSLSEISADTTDEQLADLADTWQPDSNTVVFGDILKYITQHRDNLKADQDAE